MSNALSLPFVRYLQRSSAKEAGATETIAVGARLHGGTWAQLESASHKAASIVSAASDADWCSHTRTTLHPAVRRSASVCLSRATFRASLSAHQAAFAFGLVACSGHECQKHPSTKTATFARGNTTSALRLPGKTARWTKYRRPRR